MDLAQAAPTAVDVDALPPAVPQDVRAEALLDDVRASLKAVQGEAR